ncbi:hypothetical protein OIDMADRAFT_38001 [Oidiodendron maius Zn]|uniref:Uncharacterized protein n=1 Tax=Oidiodendron maius (strain Zn) TaxID=913774 RepID=A0A0C3I248_OIDMZ|nr:hypothetical protein OIDMADRAFT_38001 [Oidiodendron maius Zn]
MAPIKAIALNYLLLLQLAFGAVIPEAPQVSKRSAILPPTSDPFYVPPAGYENQKPGAILQSRTLGHLAFGGIVPLQTNAAYQLLFRSTDSLGNASAAVTTVIVPDNANTTRVLSYQTGEDSSWANCAPSYTLQFGSNTLDGGTVSAEQLLMVAALDQGWIVNVPDHEGLSSAYPSGIQAGQATLDSIRAILVSGQLTSISPNAVYQMWGYSGGALASEWAAELQATYALELNFIGAAFGGLIPSVPSVLKTINKGLFAGFAPTGILGLASAYPALQPLLDEHLVPSTAAYFRKPLTQCLIQDALDFALQDIFAYFDIGIHILDDPVVQSILNKTGYMGRHGTPQMPVFAYKALGDEVSPIADTDALVQKLCSQGAKIEYVRDMFGEHVTEAITGAGDAFNFLIDRFNGVPIPTRCRTRTILSDILDPRSLAILGETVVDALMALLQVPIGPSSIGSI